MMALQNPLATFLYDPQNIPSIYFETQQHDETVRLFLRRHIVTNVPWIILVVILALIPVIFFLYSGPLFQLLGDDLKTLFSLTELGTVTLLYYVTVFFYGFLKFLEWHFHILIVTNQRVMDFNYSLPFTVQTTQAQLQEIQDVRHTQNGIAATIFNFGKLYVQTAGTRQNIYLDSIPEPHKAHDKIVQLLP